MAPSIKAKKSAMAGGGCGCAGAQQGGSLASAAVIDLVPHHAWASMDEQATNQFSQVGGNNASAVVDAILSPVVRLLKMPLHGGSDVSLNDHITANLGGPMKKRYFHVVKKYSLKTPAKLRGGSNAGPLDRVDNLTSFLSPNFTSVVSKLMSGGGSAGTPKSALARVNSVMDNLTLHGAKKIAELLHDTSMFKSGKSLATYAKNGALFAASTTTKSLAKDIALQHGGSALDMISLLSATNLDKLAVLLGGKGLSSITQLIAPPQATKKALSAKKKA